MLQAGAESLPPDAGHVLLPLARAAISTELGIARPVRDDLSWLKQHAACFITSLGSELAREGAPPERMTVRCTITMDETQPGAGHRIVASAIEATAWAPDADQALLARAAEAADAGCPFSNLIRASADVSYTATLGEE